MINVVDYAAVIYVKIALNKQENLICMCILKLFLTFGSKTLLNNSITLLYKNFY